MTKASIDFWDGYETADTNVTAPSSDSSTDHEPPARNDGCLWKLFSNHFCNQNVFVFYLPQTWSDDDLYRTFRQFGEIVSAKVVRKPDSSSRGYGFVAYFEESAAKEAVRHMNGHSVGYKRLRVTLKRPSASRRNDVSG